MVYMADLNIIRELGYNTLRPMSAHLGCLGIGRRSFERCIKKTTSMGLLKRVAVDGKYDSFGIWKHTTDLYRLYQQQRNILCFENSVIKPLKKTREQ